MTLSKALLDRARQVCLREELEHVQQGRVMSDDDEHVRARVKCLKRVERDVVCNQILDYWRDRVATLQVEAAIQQRLSGNYHGLPVTSHAEWKYTCRRQVLRKGRNASTTLPSSKAAVEQEVSPSPVFHFFSSLWLALASCLGFSGFLFAGDACVGEGGASHACLKLKNRGRARCGSGALRSRPGVVEGYVRVMALVGARHGVGEL